MSVRCRIRSRSWRSLLLSRPSNLAVRACMSVAHSSRSSIAFSSQVVPYVSRTLWRTAANCRAILDADGFDAMMHLCAAKTALCTFLTEYPYRSSMMSASMTMQMESLLGARATATVRACAVARRCATSFSARCVCATCRRCFSTAAMSASLEQGLLRSFVSLTIAALLRSLEAQCSSSVSAICGRVG